MMRVSLETANHHHRHRHHHLCQILSQGWWRVALNFCVCVSSLLFTGTAQFLFDWINVMRRAARRVTKVILGFFYFFFILTNFFLTLAVAASFASSLTYYTTPNLMAGRCLKNWKEILFKRRGMTKLKIIAVETLNVLYSRVVGRVRWKENWANWFLWSNLGD